MSFYQIGIWTAQAAEVGSSYNIFASVFDAIKYTHQAEFCLGWSHYNGY